MLTSNNERSEHKMDGSEAIQNNLEDIKKEAGCLGRHNISRRVFLLQLLSHLSRLCNGTEAFSGTDLLSHMDVDGTNADCRRQMHHSLRRHSCTKISKDTRSSRLCKKL